MIKQLYLLRATARIFNGGNFFEFFFRNRRSNSVAVSSTSIFSFVTNSVITPLVTKENIEVERVTTELILGNFLVKGGRGNF